MPGRRYLRDGIYFTYTLDSDSKTSAGIFAEDGSLTRTAWINIRRKPGTHSYSWDGLDDSGAQAADGLYTIQVLQHNTRYDHLGLIGNTSSQQSGQVWRGFWPLISTGAISENTGSGYGYVTMGPNEGQPGIYKYAVSDPGTPISFIPPLGVGLTFCVQDETNIYGLNTGNGDDTTTLVCCMGWKVSDDSYLTFSSGSTVSCSAPHAGTFSAFDVSQKNSGTYDPAYATAHAGTGLAVQLNAQGAGNLLAISHGPDDQVLIFNKSTGASVNPISITAPKGCAFDASGDLWIISGTTAVKYTNLTTTPSTSVSITGLSAPLQVICHPTDANIVVIADAGSAQQLKAFDTSGGPVWTYGQGGGYDATGPAEAKDKFQWSGGRVPMCFRADGSFWVVDGWPNRLLRFNSSRVYQEQIAWIPQTYVSAVDQNDPTRVFIGPLEYQLDYSVPILPGDPYASGGNHSWKLVNNWSAGLDAKFNHDSSRFNFGPSSIATLSNNRTYALWLDWTSYPVNQVIELTSSGVRECGTSISRDTDSFYADGSIRTFTNAASVQTVKKKDLTGFDGSGNPTWGSYAEIAHYPQDNQTPIYDGDFGYGGPQFPTAPNGTTFMWNSTTVATAGGSADLGMHLGGVVQGGTSHLIAASPTVATTNPFADDGAYQLGSNYTGANSPLVALADVVCGYTGEFWENSEANQYFHFDTSGVAVGGWGTTGDITIYPEGLFGYPPMSVPGRTGNATNPAMATYLGENYLWSSDEANDGALNMWKLSNSQAMQRHSGTGLLGFTAALIASAVNFPTGVTATPSSSQVVVAWNAVSGASQYTVSWGTTPGGPYTDNSGSIASGTHTYTITGLVDGTAYYIRVSATVSAVDYPASDIIALPVDLTAPVHAAGSASFINHFGTIVPTFTANPYPCTAMSSLGILGDLTQTWFGSYGYVLYEFPSRGATTSSLPAGASITPDAHWTQIGVDSTSDLTYRLDGTTYVNPGCLFVTGTPTVADATIVVDPGDSSWYILTIIAPSINASTRSSTYRVVPHGLSSPAADEIISMTASGNTGKNVFLQFLVQGAVDIVVPSGATRPTLSGIFLDLAPGYN